MGIFSFISPTILGEGYAGQQAPRIKAHGPELTFSCIISFSHPCCFFLVAALAQPRAQFFHWCLNCNFIKNLKPCSRPYSCRCQSKLATGRDFNGILSCYCISGAAWGRLTFIIVLLDLLFPPSVSILLPLSFPWLYHSKTQAAQQNVNE